MIRLCEKQPHGVSAICEQACVPRPQRSKGSTLKNQVLHKSMLTELQFAYPEQTLSHRVLHVEFVVT